MEQKRPLLATIEPPEGLFEAVRGRLARAARRAARIRLALFGSATLASGAALAYTLSYALREFYASGFYEYLTLFATDRTLALTYLQDLLYSLAESLPSLALLLLAACGVLLVWSVRRAGQSATRAFTALPAHG